MAISNVHPGASIHWSFGSLLSWLLCTLIFAGCGGETGPVTVPIKGKVTLDGKPVEKGTITFEPSDGKGGAYSAAIESGAYATNVELGPKRVRISAVKVIGRRKVYEGSKDSPEEDITQELIPPKYNSESTLDRELKAAAEDVNFDLTSK